MAHFLFAEMTPSHEMTPPLSLAEMIPYIYICMFTMQYPNWGNHLHWLVVHSIWKNKK
jgi:hypothetical protein